MYQDKIELIDCLLRAGFNRVEISYFLIDIEQGLSFSVCFQRTVFLNNEDKPISLNNDGDH